VGAVLQDQADPAGGRKGRGDAGAEIAVVLMWS
jgi:hypothetical protein